MKARLLLLAISALTWSAGALGADDEPICADRPSKSTGECTVPAGHWQIETGLADWTHDHSGGAAADFTLIGSTLIKYGISDRADVELGITPLEFLHVSGGGAHERVSGFGDTFLRLKYALTPKDALVLAGVAPFVKLPTAKRRLGNGRIEGGLVVPMSMELGKSALTLSIDPEVNRRADEDGHGHHAAMAQVINLAAQLSDKLIVSAELWGEWNWDPAGTEKQRSADGSISYLVAQDLQLDAGAHFGLNRVTPDIQLYAGISKRF